MSVTAPPDAADVGDVLAIFDRVPRTRVVAERALLLEDVHAPGHDTAECPVDLDGRCLWDGFRWHEIDVPGHELAQHVQAGLLRIVHVSRSRTTYRLRHPEAVRAALNGTVALDEPVVTPAMGPPPDLFDIVVGLEGVKNLLRLCVEATAPVHALLIGPYGTAKSLLLLELARLPESKYLVSGNTSRAGLLDLLFSPRPPRWLLIDELEKKRSPQDLAALLGVMEDGRVNRLLAGREETRQLVISVFAACNSVDNLPRELLSRFQKIRVPEYTPAQYADVAYGFLVRREGADPELAREIAEMCSRRSHDVRDARRVYRLCRGDRKLARVLAGGGDA